MATETIPETLISGPFTTPSHVANQTRDFTLTLTSTQWVSNPGISVTVSLEESLDNGQSFRLVCGFTATSGPLGSPPHDQMPSIAVTFPQRGRGNRRLRLTGSTAAPIRLGAVIVSV